jgi:hypothetical protein
MRQSPLSLDPLSLDGKTDITSLSRNGDILRQVVRFAILLLCAINTNGNLLLLMRQTG